jgi:single-strand DNA-binding protein
MNKVILIGNVVAKPETQITSSGKKLSRFSLAVSDGKKDGQDSAQFFNITVWDKIAGVADMYVDKGTKVAVEGKLQNQSWDKPDGTKGYATSITAFSMELLSGGQKGQSAPKEDMPYVEPIPKASEQSSPHTSTRPSQIGNIIDEAILNNVQSPF